MGREKFLSGLLLLLLAFCLPAAGYADISYVIDADAGTNNQGALFRVDPVSGARTLLSDFGADPNQGVDPMGVAVEPSGQILVSDISAGTGGRGALFRVDPVSGARTLLSDFGADPNQGRTPIGVAVESNGQILVIDETAGTNNQGALFRVDPVSGARTVLSDFGAGANQGVAPHGVAVESSGQILVIDIDAGTGGLGALFRVDPVSGARTVLSNFGAGANQGVDPVGVAVESNGQILVSDFAAGTGGLGALFRVDRVSGVRTVLNDFGTGTNQGVNPYGVAVFQQQADPVPTMTEWGMIIFMALAGLGAVYYLRRRTRTKS